MQTGRTRVKVATLDADTTRRYLAGIRALVTEALETRDPRVLLCTLKILARQHATVQELFGGKV